ncbi:unnamed protein product [Urochloa decumbens]|uniref:Uncharacterized protein n=1 Tax=Urochloa decumbens TaxID=240449 RepID=A0ABC9D1Y6_9POAL
MDTWALDPLDTIRVAMSLKRPCSPSDGDSERAAKRPVAKQTHKRQLYLVVDDWDRGYSIYRVGDDAFDSSDSGAAGRRAPRPTSLPVARFVAHHGYSLSFAAHGSKILAMHPAASSPGIPAFDVESLAVTSCPSPSGRGNWGSKPLYASTGGSGGGRLWAFAYPFVEVLGPEPPPTEETWSWACDTRCPPFVSTVASGYAAHPDGRTIFVSARGYKLDPGLSLPFRGDRSSTFAFDVETLQWSHVGDWLLPFKGRGYYDRDLDAWVGLCLDKTGAGRVCSCDVPPPPAAGGCASATTMPAWKLGVDVFFDDKCKMHLGATLVYMGEEESRFCVVESRRTKDDGFPPRHRVAEMTSFVLRYGKDGELRAVAGRRAYASVSYQVPHRRFDMTLNPVAFWM